jgi:hypothetical protein
VDDVKTLESTLAAEVPTLAKRQFFAEPNPMTETEPFGSVSRDKRLVPGMFVEMRRYVLRMMKVSFDS